MQSRLKSCDPAIVQSCNPAITQARPPRRARMMSPRICMRVHASACVCMHALPPAASPVLVFHAVLGSSKVSFTIARPDFVQFRKSGSERLAGTADPNA